MTGKDQQSGPLLPTWAQITIGVVATGEILLIAAGFSQMKSDAPRSIKIELHHTGHSPGFSIL